MRLAVMFAAVAACTPPPAQLVAEQRWPEACQLRGTDGREVSRAVMDKIAAQVSLDVQVLDRAALERELGVPVTGSLFDEIAIMRFSAHAEPSIVRVERIEPSGLGGGFSTFARWPTPVRRLDPVAAGLFEGLSNDGLSPRGMAALFLSPDGLPEYAEPFSHSMFDPLPVPLANASVGTFRKQSAEQDGRTAIIARDNALDARAAALEAKPESKAAMSRLRDHLARHEWFLLLPGADVRGFQFELGGRLAGTCHVDMTIAIDLGPDESPARSLNSLFPRRRTLAELPWRVL